MEIGVLRGGAGGGGCDLGCGAVMSGLKEDAGPALEGY